MAGNGIEDTKPLSEIDRLKLENLQLKAQLCNILGERDMLRAQMALEKAMTAFGERAKEIAARDEVTGWNLDLEQGCWRRKMIECSQVPE